MKTVYIASPYTKGDTAINVKRQLDCAAQLMDLGFCPIVPLLTHFQHIHKPRTYNDWLKIDFEKLRRCDVVLRLHGESKGADAEVQHALTLGIPVVYSVSGLLRRSEDIVERMFADEKD